MKEFIQYIFNYKLIGHNKILYSWNLRRLLLFVKIKRMSAQN